MKKTLLLLTLTAIISIKANAQTFQANFLGDDFNLYKGVLLKLNNESILDFNYTFYSDLSYCQSLFDNHVIYPDGKYNFVTVKDSLANRVFKVEDIVDKTGAPFAGSSYLDKPIFVLKDTFTNQKIYFKYDTKYDFNFPFLTSPIKIDENTFCSKIEKEIDDFTGEIKYHSPISNSSGIASISFNKNISNTRTVYYLSLRTHGNTVVVDGVGATILFTDGTKWSKQVKIDVEADKTDFEYSAFISLTQADIQTLTTKKIKKFRLYIYDEEVNPADAEKYKVYLTCLKKKV